MKQPSQAPEKNSAIMAELNTELEALSKELAQTFEASHPDFELSVAAEARLSLIAAQIPEASLLSDELAEPELSQELTSLETELKELFQNTQLPSEAELIQRLAARAAELPKKLHTENNTSTEQALQALFDETHSSLPKASEARLLQFAAQQTKQPLAEELPKALIAKAKLPAWLKLAAPLAAAAAALLLFLRLDGGGDLSPGSTEQPLSTPASIELAQTSPTERLNPSEPAPLEAPAPETSAALAENTLNTQSPGANEKRPSSEEKGPSSEWSTEDEATLNLVSVLGDESTDFWSELNNLDNGAAEEDLEALLATLDELVKADAQESE